MIGNSKKGWIGVDIGTRAVKLAQVDRDGGVVRLRRAAVIQRPTAWADGDQLGMEQPESSRDEIRAARQGGGFRGRNAVCLLPMNVCQLRGLTVPPGGDGERRAIIEDELSAEWEELRVAMEFDYWELDVNSIDKGQDRHNVNVLTAARPWIAQLASDCRRSGLDCWAVDGAPLALARAVSITGELGSGQRALAVDWGYSNATICVVGDGRVWYTRRASECGFFRGLAAVAERLGVTPDQAQHLADAYGVAAGSDESPEAAVCSALTDALAPALEGLCVQLRRTLHFIESQRRHLQPVGVWLMGGGGSLRGLPVWLANEIQLPVHTWRIPCGKEVLPAVAKRTTLFAGAAALSTLAWRAA